MAYHIRLPQFEGPLELLSALIEKQKLDVTRVSLAKITDQYLEYIAEKEHISLENLAWFLVIASRLILIKSKALLPVLKFDDEEEEEIRDLEYQLREYKKFKEAALKMGAIMGLHRAMFDREGYLGIHSVFYPPHDVDPSDLRLCFMNVLSEIPVFEKLEEEEIEEVVSLEDKIVALQETLRQKIETSFAEIAQSAKNRVEVIVSFLAMLELVKQRILDVDQSGLFRDIKLRHKKTESVSSQ